MTITRSDRAAVLDTPVPWPLFLSLRDFFRLRNFVETGTSHGDTAYVASTQFSHVYTIELLEEFYHRQCDYLKRAGNVTRLCGRSVDHLAAFLPLLDGPTLFFLDAHWSGYPLPAPEEECPLLAELELICGTRQPAGDVIAIDDWGMFVRGAHPPHDPAKWPTSAEVAAAIRSHWPYTLTPFVNILLATPVPVLGGSL